MIKVIFYLLFLTPLCFFNLFWLISFYLVILSMIFIYQISFNFYSYISFFLGYDFLSYFLILLSLWVCFLMILSSGKIYFLKDYFNLFNFMIIFLLMFLILTFSSMNLFFFYLFFEASLIPTLIIIIGWGYQPERIQAGLYLFFYTMLASLPLLFFIFMYYDFSYSLEMYFMNKMNFNNLIIYFMVNMVFFVKIPMYMVHLWLPKAHVEAPVSGSMILAGVMLKLGGYGLLRFMILFMELGLKVNIFFINLSMIGSIFLSLVCLRQSDMKSLIAYSSVVHMGLMLSGLLTFSYMGFLGSFVIMIGHGLCSSGLFVLVNLNYERLLSRNLYLNKGMINIAPSLSLWWFLLVSSNMAAPPSLNLLGEILLMTSLVNFSWMMIYLLIFLAFFSAVYSLYLYAYSQHGSNYMGIMSFLNVNFREYLILFLHWIPLNLMILNSSYFFI
uniref:NADH-ubiquinone oxidoreductase chain 4 n=1 Tax=Cryptolaemus montrouzieri TaxID=559131 RepID=A0A0X9PS67_9CUCU|nr:NADH dehydrogenase subunit 4 [Cryptolaemus montrouzieri]AMA06687.1 NADH dehydrogenase subunit 4 [Cryptolaemus montrouzieri]AMA06698.1 NADH dehydrogenase subunit 4 [Cryptolaemus montrouzieri]